MAVEKTVIKDSKSDGGIIGMTRKKPALLRWYLTRQIVGEYASTIKTRGDLQGGLNDMNKSTQSSNQRDDDHANVLIEHVLTKMANPFDLSEANSNILLNISTGLHASDEVKESLLTAVTKGKQKMENFVESCLEIGGQGNFYAPISKTDLKTFDTMSTKVNPMSQNKNKKLKMDPELIFRRALCLTKFREDADLEIILNHPIGSVPVALFHEQGSQRKTVKSELGAYLESKCDNDTPFERDVNHTVYIRDAMSIIHAMPVQTCTVFDDIGALYIQGIARSMQRAHTIIDVFDRYDNEMSIKEAERIRRSNTLGNGKRYSVSGNRPIPPWNRFLSVRENKVALIAFLGEYAELKSPQFLKQDETLILAGCFAIPTQTKVITQHNVDINPDFNCDHEEAVTRIIFHADQVDKENGRLNSMGKTVIKANDTDIMVLAVHYFPRLQHTSELWMELGNVTERMDLRRMVPVHKICEALQPTECAILPAVHCLTGCDSVSAFYGIGKKSVINCLKTNGCDMFSELENLHIMSEDAAIAEARRLVAQLYDPKHNMLDCHNDLNKLRFRLSLKNDRSLAKLPPCEDSFRQHVRRTTYQTRIWMNADRGVLDMESPVGHGWENGNTGLVPTYYTGDTATDILQNLFCNCSGKKPCSAQFCTCVRNGFDCINICECSTSNKCFNNTDRESEHTVD